MNEVLKMIHERRSVRDYKPTKIDALDLATILEAGRHAPSAWNGQPWHFTVVQKKSLLDRIAEVARDALPEKEAALVEAQPWLVAPDFHYFYHSPCAIFISGQKDSKSAMADCAVGMMNMLYAAESLGIQTCIVQTALVALETEYGDGFRKDLELPENYDPLYVLVLGYTSESLPMAAPRKDNFVNYI
ncbi:MAG: nitroreductase family protein [Defluviitaleaceae bacterium]|nr:nitroreductase family protein [Defluviitaleaceae bacterium]